MNYKLVNYLSSRILVVFVTIGLCGCSSGFNRGEVDRDGYSMWISNEMQRLVTSPQFIKSCPGINRPGYYCTGVMIHAKESGEDWTKPYSSHDDNKLSFSYLVYPILKHNQGRGSYGVYGIAFWPAGYLRTDGDAYEENFTCGYPRDGGTLGTLGVHQCGAGKLRCQDVGIYTADDFNNSNQRCGFAMNIPGYDTQEAFSTIMEVEKKRADANVNLPGQTSHDEFLLKPWPDNDLTKIPLMAFFINLITSSNDPDFFTDQLNATRVLQLDFYRKSGIFAPIVVITGDTWGNPTFSGEGSYQSPEIPQYVHVFSGTNIDYSSYAFTNHK